MTTMSESPPSDPMGRLGPQSRSSRSRETDEDVLERGLASRDREHIGVVFVLLDQTGRCIDGQDLAVVHDRDAVAHRLRLLHRMRGQQDAASALANALDSVPKLAPRLRVEA